MRKIPDGYREAVCYIQIVDRAPGPGVAYDWGTKATAVRMTTEKPRKPLPGTVVVKVRIQVPKAAFGPYEPEAIIQVPESLVQPVLAVAEESA